MHLYIINWQEAHILWFWKVIWSVFNPKLIKIPCDLRDLCTNCCQKHYICQRKSIYVKVKRDFICRHSRNWRLLILVCVGRSGWFLLRRLSGGTEVHLLRGLSSWFGLWVLQRDAVTGRQPLPRFPATVPTLLLPFIFLFFLLSFFLSFLNSSIFHFNFTNFY